MVNYPWPQEKAEADHVLERIKQTGSTSAAECIAIEADLSTIEGPQHLINEVIRQTGKKIDILVNNAGISIMVPLKDIAVAQWDAQVNLNVRGMLLLTQATLPHLAQDSRIVNLSSVGARQGYHGASIYNGTKSMIESFTRCWALWVSTSNLPLLRPFYLILTSGNLRERTAVQSTLLGRVQRTLRASPMQVQSSSRGSSQLLMRRQWGRGWLILLRSRTRLHSFVKREVVGSQEHVYLLMEDFLCHSSDYIRISRTKSWPRHLLHQLADKNVHRIQSYAFKARFQTLPHHSSFGIWVLLVPTEERLHFMFTIFTQIQRRVSPRPGEMPLIQICTNRTSSVQARRQPQQQQQI